MLLAYVTKEFHGEEITGTYYEKELQNTNKIKFGVEKVIKEKGNKL